MEVYGCLKYVWYRCFFSTFFWVMVCVFLGCLSSSNSSQEVFLSSSLRQSSLCPKDPVVSFTCTVTNGSYVNWRVGGPREVDPRDGTRLIAFNRNQVGTLLRADRSFASLLECSPEENCTSVLNLVRPAHPDTTTIQCYNGNYSTMQYMEYYHEVADPPSEPMNITIQPNEPRTPNLFNISWMPAPMSRGSELSHYIVELDEESPIWVEATSVTLYSVSLNKVKLRTVDKCGQKSTMACETWRGGESTGMPNEGSTGMPTIGMTSEGHHILGSKMEVYLSVALLLFFIALA